MAEEFVPLELLGDVEELEWSPDAATDLEIYTQLVKVGHFDRARQFYQDHLNKYEQWFPVAVEHANALLEQGAFGEASVFLRRALKFEPASDGVELDRKLSIFNSMLRIARVHTHLEYLEAIKHAEQTLTELQQSSESGVALSPGITILSEWLPQELLSVLGNPIDPVRLKTLVVSVRVLDAALRCAAEPRFAPDPPARRSAGNYEHTILTRNAKLFATRDDLLATAEEIWQQGFIWEACDIFSFIFSHSPMASNDWGNILLQLYLGPDSKRNEIAVVRLATMSIMTDLVWSMWEKKSRLSTARPDEERTESEDTADDKELAATARKIMKHVKDDRIQQIDTPLEETGIYQRLVALSSFIVSDEVYSYAEYHEDFTLSLLLISSFTRRFPVESRYAGSLFSSTRELWGQIQDVLGLILLLENHPELGGQTRAVGTKEILGHIKQISLRGDHPRSYQLRTILQWPIMFEGMDGPLRERLEEGVEPHDSTFTM